VPSYLILSSRERFERQKEFMNLETKWLKRIYGSSIFFSSILKLGGWRYPPKDYNNNKNIRKYYREPYLGFLL